MRSLSPVLVTSLSLPLLACVERYPSYEVVATPPIPFHGAPDEPSVIIRVTAPNGKVDEQVVLLVNQPVCAYCLPATGSSGCDHDCRWDPFEGTVGSLHFEVTGRHRVVAQLKNSKCELRGGRAVIEARPLPP